MHNTQKKVFDTDFSATTEIILLTTSLFMRSCFLEQISLFFYRLWTFFGWFILLQLIFLLFVIKRTRWALDRKKNKFEFLNAWHQKISLLSWEVNHFGKAFSRKIFEKLSLPLKPSKMMMIVSVSLRTKLTLVKGKKRKKKELYEVHDVLFMDGRKTFFFATKPPEGPAGVENIFSPI